MDFYLIDPAGPLLYLPVNPGELSIKTGKMFQTVNIINMGEIDFPHGEKIREISFSSFFPLNYDSGYCRCPNIPQPQTAMSQLINWTQSHKPVRLIITGANFNSLVLVSANSSTFRGGEPGDIYYDLTCRTWREAKVRTLTETTFSGGSSSQYVPPRPDTRPVPKTYVVKTGDCLYNIAKMYLGNGSKWKQIYDTNKALIGPNPHLINAGMKLVMPQ